MEVIEKIQLDKDKDEISNKDEGFDLFQLICQKNPSQILRYTRFCTDVEPLWYQAKGLKQMYEKLSMHKKCHYCGSDMIFEMQVMPQVFDYVKDVINVDWGIIVVFTYSLFEL